MTFMQNTQLKSMFRVSYKVGPRGVLLIDLSGYQENDQDLEFADKRNKMWAKSQAEQVGNHYSK